MPEQSRALSPRQSSSRAPVTRRLAHSWTRWLRNRREARELRRRRKALVRLAPYQAALANQLAPLLQHQQETLLVLGQLQEQLAALVEMPERRHQETKELLVEVLQTLQPPPEQVIVQQLGLPPLLKSFPSSGS